MTLSLNLTVNTFFLLSNTEIRIYHIYFTMKKTTFLKSTIILTIGGLITKVLGMLIKIVMSRLLGTDGIGLYMMILPTFSLFVTIASLGLPIAVSKLVAEDTKNNKNLIFSLLPVSFLINTILILFILCAAPFISNYLIQEPNLKQIIKAMAFVMPFTSISAILRSYFFGKQQMIPHVVSNVVEDIVRLIILIVGIPIFIKFGIEKAIFFIIISNIISELSSILVFFFFLPKKFHIYKNDFRPNRLYIKDALSIGVPNTIGRIIGSIGYFLEPIVLNFVLHTIGYSNHFIVYQYGILSGYSIPLILLPSFFSGAISQALLPIISKSYVHKNYKYTKKKIKQAILYSLIIAIPYTLLLMLKPEIPLKFIYNTNEGITYIRFLAPICLFQYIQSPLAFCLDAMGKSKISMKSTLYGTMIRTSLLFLLSFLKIGLWGLVLSTSLNILFVTFYQLKKVKEFLSN